MKRMKNLIAGIVILSVALPGFAQAEECQNRGPHGRGPQLTDTQRSCLEGLIGRPGEGERPTHEQMDAAFASCGIEKPNKRPAQPVTDQE